MPDCLRRLLAFALCGLIASCGGGSGGDAPRAVTAATASAAVGEPLVLDGSASVDPAGNTLRFSWRLTSAPEGSAASLTGTASPHPVLVADLPGEYRLELSVHNGSIGGVPAQVVVTATVDLGPFVAAARLSATLDAGDGTTRLEWLDTLPRGSIYRVELIDGSGNGTLLAEVRGQGGLGSAMRWSHAAPETASYRVRGTYLGANADLASAGGATRFAFEMPDPLPTIRFSQTEPVSDEVILTLEHAGALPVEWFIGEQSIGAGDGSADEARTRALGTAGLAGSVHAVRARITTGTDAAIEVGRSMRVGEPHIQVSAGTSSLTYHDSRWLYVDAWRHDEPIASVEAWIDGAYAGALSEFNLCSKWCSLDEPDRYGFLIDAARLGSGEHSYVVRVIDASGRAGRVEGLSTVNLSPVIEIDSPQADEVVSGAVKVRGRILTDAPRSVRVTVESYHLGRREITLTSPGTFELTLTADSSPTWDSDTLEFFASDATGSSTRLSRRVRLGRP